MKLAAGRSQSEKTQSEKTRMERSWVGIDLCDLSVNRCVGEARAPPRFVRHKSGRAVLVGGLVSYEPCACESALTHKAKSVTKLDRGELDCFWRVQWILFCLV